MKKSSQTICIVLALVCSFSINTVISQTPVDVTENTLKVKGLGEEVFYFGFAEGDQIIFSFEEVNNKELKELEIVELPSSSKFMDYKTSKISNKIINVPRKGIYKFRFANSALGGRICKFKIQRIPSGEVTKNFNTSVYFRIVQDTIYTPVQEKYLISSDTVAQSMEAFQKVSSQTAINGNTNRGLVEFILPDKTVSWSYYIGVGQESVDAFNKSNSNFLKSSAGIASAIPGYGSLAALAISGLNTFLGIQGKDNVKYWFISDYENALKFQNGLPFMQYKQGDVISEASQMKIQLRGKLLLGLMNDNIREPIEVNVKISAITVSENWGLRTVQKMSIRPRELAYLGE